MVIATKVYLSDISAIKCTLQVHGSFKCHSRLFGARLQFKGVKSPTLSSTIGIECHFQLYMYMIQQKCHKKTLIDLMGWEQDMAGSL